MPYRLKALTVLLSLTVLGFTAANAQITPSQDSYTSTATPKTNATNYGAAVNLIVDGTISQTFIQFNLASIPTGSSVTQATLKLYVNNVTTPGSFDVAYVNGEWTELTIKGADMPQVGTTIVACTNPLSTVCQPITTADKNQFILVDITPAVQAWLDGSQANTGIALVTDAASETALDVSFDSKENTGTSHAPELDIVFAGTNAGGITGITTAGGGLNSINDNGTVTLSLTTACAATQVLQWSGSGWVCATVSGGGGGGGIGGSGTVNSLALFSGATSVGSSNVFQGTNGNVGVGTTTPQATLDVNGAVNAATSFNLGETPFAFGSPTTNNAFLGFAGNSATNNAGQYNTAIGYLSLYGNQGNTTTNAGTGNTATGVTALYSNCSNGACTANGQGNGNTASGAGALYGNTTGYDNSASGANALFTNTTGTFNTAAGAAAFDVNTTGSSNTGLGAFAGPPPGFTTQLNNATAVGAFAVVTQSNSLVLGGILNAGQCVAASNCATTSVGIGTTAPQATLDVEGPSGNPPTVIFGSASNPATFTLNGTANFGGAVTFATNAAGGSAVTGNNSLTTGGYGTNGGSFSTASSAGSGVVGQDSSTAGGYGGYFSSASASGYGIWGVNTTGGYAGYFTGPVGITGSETVGGNLSASGVVSGSGFQIGSNLFDYGSYALQNAFLGFAGNSSMSGPFNTASGYQALFSDTTGYSDTAAGAGAMLYNTTGNYNTANGINALYFSTTGSNNTATGAGSILNNTTGASNTASGVNSLVQNTTGNYNTAAGFFAGQTNDKSNLTGSNDTALGAGAAFSTGTLSNATAIGSNAEVSASNSLVLGSISGVNSATASAQVGIGTTAPQATFDVEAPTGQPTINFGSATNTAALTVNGSTTVTGTTTLANLTVTGTCTGCGGGGGGITAVKPGNGISTSVSGSTVTVTNTGILSITNGHGISSLGLFGTTPSINIDTTVVPVLSGGNTFTGSQLVNGSFAATTSSGATGAPAVEGIAQAISGGSNGGYFLTGDPAGTGVVGINTAGGYAGYFQGNVAVTGNTAVSGNTTMSGNAIVTGTLAVGGDTLPMSHNPRMTFSGTVTTFVTSQLQPAGYFIPDQPIVITRVTISAVNLDSVAGGIPPGNCDTPSKMGFTVYSAQGPITQLFTAGYKNLSDSGPLNVPVAAETGIEIVGLEASGGVNCQSGSNMTATVEYAMQ